MLIAQGADLKAFNEKLQHDSTAVTIAEVRSERTGCISKCDARIIGEVIRDLGGGRLTKEAAIHHGVGADQIAKPGEQVQKGSVLCRVHANSPLQAGSACDRLKGAFEISSKRTKASPLLTEVIQ